MPRKSQHALLLWVFLFPVMLVIQLAHMAGSRGPQPAAETTGGDIRD